MSIQVSLQLNQKKLLNPKQRSMKPLTKAFLFVAATAVVTMSANIPMKMRTVDTCPQFSPMGNFSLEKFLGKWHEIERYPNPMEVGCSCLVSDYEVTSQGHKGSHITINMTYVQSEESKRTALKGLYLTDDTSAEFVFMPLFDPRLQPNVFFLDTDYETYALQYQCQNLFPYGQIEFAFILSRTDSLPADVIAELKQKIADLGSDISQFEEPQHIGCPIPQ